MKETRPEKLERISQLAEKGKRESDEMAEYSIKFYYTNQVTWGERENQLLNTSVLVYGEHGRHSFVCGDHHH